MNSAVSRSKRLPLCGRGMLPLLCLLASAFSVSFSARAQDTSTSDSLPINSQTQVLNPDSLQTGTGGMLRPSGGSMTGSPSDASADTTNQGSVDDQGRSTTRGNQNSMRRRILPPDQPTEFQRLVTASVGVKLPIFGASLFRNDQPSTFAPADNIPVTADYPIGPGDELRIQVYGQVNRRGLYLVDRSGDITFPEVGTIHVAGVPYSQLQSFLTTRFSRVYRNFELNVNLGHLRSMQVYVVGAARSPGTYTISSLSTLLNALFASGGPLPQGSLRDIQVLRGGQAVAHFDLYDVLLHGTQTAGIRLQPEDVIFIPPVGPQVAISGSVNNPAIYEVHPGDTIKQALALAGGTTSLALGSEVQVTQIYQHSMRNVVEVDLSKTDPPVANGDIVTVRPILDRYRDAVTLRGNVSYPGRYVWHPGMRILDLVPTRDQLITPDYYRRRNALGAPEKAPPVRRPILMRDKNGNLVIAPNCPATPQNGVGASPNPSVSSDPRQVDCIVNSQTGGDQNATADAATSGAATGANVDQAVNQTNVPETTQYVDPVTGALSSTPPSTQGQQAQGTVGSQGGNSLGTALTESNGIFKPANKLVLSAPDVDWSYAVIERLNPNTLKTMLIPFNPGLLYKQKDQNQDLLLEAGDVVTFFSTADIRVPSVQQTRFVRLEGEFVSSGIYSVEPGETLRHLVARAGGLTPDAYLYGSEFSRESTRRVQQQRLIEYANTLDEQVSAASASSASKAISAADAAAAAAAATEARASIARLRQSVPSGRIVLQVKPDSQGLASLPDLPLEDGDRFVVPHVPSTVAVEGRVYSANAYIYQQGRKERDYLKLAGGPDFNADRKRQFILRADGSVYSAQYGNVSKAHIFPGDTIVIPPQIEHSNLLREILDISTIFGQLGLAAAAINVLGL